MNQRASGKFAGKMAGTATDQAPGEMSKIYASLEKINLRLDKLERALEPRSLPPSDHPSIDKLSIAEAIADSLFMKEKACTFEPSKPCDHCSMCNTRGF